MDRCFTDFELGGNLGKASASPLPCDSPFWIHSFFEDLGFATFVLAFLFCHLDTDSESCHPRFSIDL